MVFIPGAVQRLIKNVSPSNPLSPRLIVPRSQLDSPNITTAKDNFKQTLTKWPVAFFILRNILLK
jgi:hypothetical protein